MDERKVVVTISPDGKVEARTEGYVGEECMAATKNLDVVLGGAHKEHQKTDEYFKGAPPVEAFISGLNQ